MCTITRVSLSSWSHDPISATVVPFASQFVGKGKDSAWNTWLAYPEATNGFMIQPFETINLESEKFQIIERYVCILYDRTTNITSVNKLRESMFLKKSSHNYLQLKLLSFSIQEDASTKLAYG